ncbi:hypothetical protein [Chromobacterium sp. IIBBL 290-4]|uniref:hypothetical protein n=1 Tax=Chromobacterium sp. IIBBL 290-4 TaxID=2953890 RepID=UPI0020B704CB|nr:hypothetical protein [Chromobacterium sp. IIBBL 290-4]UTH72231.1 hypothetical protein NKT35_11755 [Chromobacterium sp. IIBBL 290-4]
MKAQFDPAGGNAFHPIGQLIRPDVVQDMLAQPMTTQNRIVGMLEGELAFALVADEADPCGTIHNCATQLLLRLGLKAPNLTPDQERLSGWGIGLMGSIAASFDECSDEQPPTA